MKKNYIFLLIPIASLCWGCSFNATFQNRIQDKIAAENITNKFYSYLKQNDTVNLYRLFSDTFFTITSRGKMDTIFDALYKEGGSIINDTVVNWKTSIIKGTHASSQYVFLYKVIRSIKSSNETITLMKERDSIKIIGYNVNMDL